jgi:hypothetical protein
MALRGGGYGLGATGIGGGIYLATGGGGRPEEGAATTGANATNYVTPDAGKGYNTAAEAGYYFGAPKTNLYPAVDGTSQVTLTGNYFPLSTHPEILEYIKDAIDKKNNDFSYKPKEAPKDTTGSTESSEGNDNNSTEKPKADETKDTSS